MLLSLARYQGKKQHRSDGKDGSDEEEWGLQAGRKVGKDGVDPKKGEVGLRRRLDDRRIRLPAGTKGP